MRLLSARAARLAKPLRAALSGPVRELVNRITKWRGTHTATRSDPREVGVIPALTCGFNAQSRGLNAHVHPTMVEVRGAPATSLETTHADPPEATMPTSSPSPTFRGFEARCARTSATTVVEVRGAPATSLETNRGQRRDPGPRVVHRPSVAECSPQIVRHGSRRATVRSGWPDAPRLHRALQ